MAHNVICSVCKQTFDRDKIEYCATGSRRYAHATCAPHLPVITPCKCIYCKQYFDKNSEDYVKIEENQFAHKACAIHEQTREKTDEEKLYDYIKELYNISYVLPNMRKQIKHYVEEYNYTYSGIMKALNYFYVIKKNDIDKANLSLGIVPYVYQNAYEYYYSLWEAKQKNSFKLENFNDFIPKAIEIIIKQPERKPFKSKKFSFLDEEVEE